MGTEEEAFILQWDLDEKAQQALYKMDEATRSRAMQGFSPKDVSRGASVAFMGFARSIGGGTVAGGSDWTRNGGAPTARQAFAPSNNNNPGTFGEAPESTGNEAIDEFVMQWGLDAAATNALMSLDEDARLRAMTGFNPKDVTRGASAAFMAFAKGISAGAGRGSAVAARPHTVSAIDPTWGEAEAAIDPVASFAESWGLDAAAQNALMNLDPMTQQRVMDGFSPKDVSKGASAAFMGFLKSVANSVGKGQGKVQGQGPGLGTLIVVSGGQNEAAAMFAEKWGLDTAAQNVLMNLDSDVQQRVMSGFSPKDVSRGASVAFMGFVKSITGGAMPRMQPHVQTQAPQTQTIVLGQWRPVEPSTPTTPTTTVTLGQWRPVEPAAPTASVVLGQWRPVDPAAPAAPVGQWTSVEPSRTAVQQSELDLFVANWGLDTKAQQSLLQLDPSTQRRVMDGFSPKDVSRGASAAFMGFVKSVANSGGGGGAWRGSGAPTAAQAFAPSRVSVGSSDNPDVDNFVATWGLDSKAESVLRGMDPDAQQRVMGSFSPKDVSRGASAAFMGFARNFGQPRTAPY